MKQSELLLREKERKGLLITLAIRLVVLIIISVAHVFAHHSSGEIIRVSLLSGVLILLNTYSLVKLVRGSFLTGAGIIGLITDFFIMVFLPYNWYLSVGFYDRVPSTYLLKTSLPIIASVLVAMNALATRPVYPVLVALMFDLVWAVIFFIVIGDPRTVYTDSFIENFFSDAIMPSTHILTAFTITAGGFMLSYLAYSNRKLLASAVMMEVHNSQLGRYFSPAVLDQIKSDESLFQAKKSNIVVMFTDIRNFTAISENMDPARTVEMLRGYHAVMVETIYQYGGTIDKFLGDGIMVTFGTPVEKDDDCERALACAIAMSDNLKKYNEAGATEGRLHLAHGIGMHYGEAVTGNIGSEDRLEYTVIGDAVNLASRIEGQCRITGRELLVSGDFAEKVGHLFALEEVGDVLVKGRVKPVKLFSPA